MPPDPAPEDTRLPVTTPAGAPKPPPPWLNWLKEKRFLIVVLIIVAFLAAIFSISEMKRSTPLTSEQVLPPDAKVEKPQVALTPETEIAPVPEAVAEPAPPTTGPTEKAIPPSGHPPVQSPFPVPPRVEPVIGEAFTSAVIKIMDDQVNQTWLGWRPNAILFGMLRLTDNVNNLQIGVLEVARRTTVILNENMSRFALTEAYNPHLNEAMNYLMVSTDKYWFPSASGKYREAIQDLRKYIEDLKNKRSKFYPRVDNLIALMMAYKDILGSCFHNLIKDKEADGSTVSWFACDNYFYYSQGVALGMSEVLEAVREDFSRELLKKNSHKLLEEAVHALHASCQLHPWLITNAAKDGILANHRANLATYIGEAEHYVSTLQTVLATN
ncbi:MAG: hypothetical protein BZ151_07210 [Desulfobacca sp. 4484_104]|nr:MAG: hypothetical protein BZ151_07210 [Desulfobacca sp. 4484_104]